MSLSTEEASVLLEPSGDTRALLQNLEFPWARTVKLEKCQRGQSFNVQVHVK